MQTLKNISLKEYTSFKIGGKAEQLLIPASCQDLVDYLKVNPLPSNAIVLGGGSNILFGDQTVKPPVLLINFANISTDDSSQIVTVEAGVKLPRLAKYLCENGFSGLEFICGIPGTVGGAVAMNAGVGEKWISESIEQVRAVDYAGKEVVIKKEDAHFGYRTSIFQKEKLIVTAVLFKLHTATLAAIQEKMDDYVEKRRVTQPLTQPSAGSIFKNPKSLSAAKMIDEAGCRGLKVGGAQVSLRHAGFIVNLGEAKAVDVMQLINLVKQKVRDKFQVELELEIKTFL